MFGHHPGDPDLETAEGKELVEHVTVDAGKHWPDASPNAFAAHFEAAQGRDVMSFPNVGGDATLVAPREAGPRGAYGHMAAFVRGAPAAQQVALWAAVGEALARTLAGLGERPVWLSTAGRGVPWLHVRLDSEPKYYRTQGYTVWPPNRKGVRRRRQFLRAMEQAARAGQSEDMSAEGNWPGPF